MPERMTLPPYDTYDVSTFVIHNGVVYIGHFGGCVDDDGNVLASVEEQTVQTFRNLERALQQIDLGLEDLLKVSVILKDISDFDDMHQGWVRVFPSEYPVRTTITSGFVSDECHVQIEGFAALR